MKKELVRTSNIYRIKHLDRSRGIENKISIDQKVSRRFQWPNCFDGSRRCRASIKKTESSKIWLDGLRYLSRGINKTQKNFDRRSLCLKVSSCYRASIEQIET